MAISKGSSTGRESFCFTLAVERYDIQNMECIVYVGDTGQGICCHSFFELALQMEKGIEKMDYPTHSVQKRKFSNNRLIGDNVLDSGNRSVLERRDGALKTFRVRVRQCQYATWQGQIAQVGHEKDSVLFKSFLELMQFLDGALSDSQSGIKDEKSLTGSFTDALLLGGRYNGICLKEQSVSGVLMCSRKLDGGLRETFSIRPMFRENHTFQGILYWSEGRQKKNFRSFLELLFLIMSAEGRRELGGDDM